MVGTVSKEKLITIGKSSTDGERQQKYAKMASSAQVLRGNPNVQTARRPFSNALQCQTARHSLKCGAGTVSSHRHRSIAVITAAKDSSRQGVEEKTVRLPFILACVLSGDVFYDMSRLRDGEDKHLTAYLGGM